MASAIIGLATGRKFNFSKYIFDSMVRNVDIPSKFFMYPRFLQVIINAQVEDLSSHNNQYTSHALTQKVFANKRRVGKGFSGVDTPLFATIQNCSSIGDFQAQEEGQEVREEEEIQVFWFKEIKKGKRTEAIDADEDITLTDAETQVDLGAKLQGRKDDDDDAIKDENIDWNVVVEQMQEKHLANIRKYQSLKRKPVSIAQARKNMIIYLKNMVGYKMEHFRGMTYDKVIPIFEREYNKVQTLFKPDKDEEPTKKRVAEETLIQESFKKLKAVEVLGSHSTQDTPTHDPKEISEEDVQNMLEIVPVSEFKVEALQVKYPLIHWEIHSEGSRSYWKIIRVGGITKAYHSFEDMLKGFDREDLDALWRLVKEKFSTAVPTVDEGKSIMGRTQKII
nr:hypothetical protein [Tanacetum cinerariifolium]